MLIDWFTVAAQAVNFLILVWLLKRFLYQPILHAIDAREQRIAAELADADAKRAAAQQEHDTFQRKNEAFEQQRSALMNAAIEEARAERLRLLNATRDELDGLRAKRQEALRNEHQSLSTEIVRRVQAEVFAITRKVLNDLAETSLEERMVEVFIRHLRNLSRTEQTQLTSALNASVDPVRIRTTLDMPPAQRAAIEDAIQEIFGTKIQGQFETTPDLISGIELGINGQKLAWSIAEYLASLENSIGEPLTLPRSKQDGDKSGT